MPRRFTPKVVTANDLLEGHVIYLAPDRRWSPRLAEAELFFDEAAALAALRIAESQPEIAVGPYLADAAPGPDGRPHPVHFREAFRAAGGPLAGTSKGQEPV